jgi:hypothetical protein
MGFFPPYILKISITLFVLYTVYWLLFRRLTFYTWNRWYLMILSVVSFFIPLIDISSLFGVDHNEVVNVYIPSLQSVIESPDSSAYRFFLGSLTWMDGIYLLVATGTFVLIIRLVIQYLSFRKMVRSADVIMDGPVRVYQVHGSVVPFSFGNSIFINAAQHSEVELREIIRHEFIHVKQRHSIDIMVSEFLVMLNWYNPAAWLIRNAVRQNLEFIADEQVIRTGVNRKEYQYMLLKVIGVAPFAITSKFNFNSLKKRIVMMNKNKTARVHLLRFAVVIPVVALSLVAFRTQHRAHTLPSLLTTVTDTVPEKKVSPDDISTINVNNKTIEIVLKDGKRELYDVTDPKQKAAFEKKYGKLKPPPVPPVPPTPAAAPSPRGGVSGKIVMPDDILSIDVWKVDGQNRIKLRTKDGKTEEYDLNKPEEKADFEEKYGKLSGLDAPAPPAAPEVAAEAEAMASPAPMAPPVPPVAPVSPAPVDRSNDPFFKKNPNIRSIYIDDSETLFITLKNGTKETYSLSDAADKKKVIAKYGSLPVPPPPPPAPAAPKD